MKRYILIFSSCFLMFPGMAVAMKPLVFVSITPQKYFVQQICGDRIDVEVMVEPGASPATYEPKPIQMRLLGRSRIYFAVGVPFERRWLSKIAGINRDMIVVHTDEKIKKRRMDHGYTHHDQRGFDPHIWLSPLLVKVQATEITQELNRVFPEWSGVFNANLAMFISAIDQLDQDLRERLSGMSGREFMVFHPSWGYFADAYNLRQIAVEVDGKEPKPAQLANLISYAREHGIRTVLAQPQFSRKSADLIAREIDGDVLLIDPLAADWAANLRQVAESIKGVQ